MGWYERDVVGACWVWLTFCALVWDYTPSARELAALAGCSAATAWRALRRLADLGYVEMGARRAPRGARLLKPHVPTAEFLAGRRLLP